MQLAWRSGSGGSGQLSGATILSYANFILGLPAGGFFQAKIDNATGYADVRATTSSIQAAVQEFANPDIGAADAAAIAGGLAARPKPAKPGTKKPAAPAAPLPQNTTLTVLNGNGIAGSASNASYLLGQRA